MDSENLKNTLAEYQQEVRQEFADHENFMMRLYSFLYSAKPEYMTFKRVWLEDIEHQSEFWYNRFNLEPDEENLEEVSAEAESAYTEWRGWFAQWELNVRGLFEDYQWKFNYEEEEEERELEIRQEEEEAEKRRRKADAESEDEPADSFSSVSDEERDDYHREDASDKDKRFSWWDALASEEDASSDVAFEDIWKQDL